MRTITMIYLLLFAAVVTAQDVQIGTQVWMKENLKVGNCIPVSQPSANNGVIEAYCNGGYYYYQWDEMMNYNYMEKPQGICPDGYHIPSWSDWQVLINFVKKEGLETLPVNDNVDMTSAAGINLRSTTEWKKSGAYPGRDLYGFSVMPSGYVYGGYSVAFQGIAGYFWTSTKPNAWPVMVPFGCCVPAAGTKMAYVYKDGAYRSYFPVRCIKD